MRRLSSILLILVVGAAAYNFWQLEKMRGELRAIRAKVHVEQSKESKTKTQAQDGLLIVLADVKQHNKNARSLMKKGEYREARQELDESLRRLERASELSAELAADADSGLGKTWSKVRYEVRKAWKDISEDRGKGG